MRPILKWAGGKRQLLPEIRPYYPVSFRRYYEPFLGSGAVFIDLWNLGRLDGRGARLTDVNVDVIGCYAMVRDHVEEVIRELGRLEDGHRQGGQAHFYEVRDERFNPARAALEPGRAGARAYTPHLAAMLVYLNRTGYNGLFRVNSRGGFNVPAGRYASVRVCDAGNLRALSRALRREGVGLDAVPFDEALAGAGAGDFVYLDPPYVPVSQTASFTSYTSGGFTPAHQRRLQEIVIDLATRGAAVLLSNSVAPDVRALYDTNETARAAGLRASLVAARRAINSRASARGAIQEYLISNVARAGTG